ncbi:hypothetical protein L4174_021330 [Photobacterium sp. CCB-ST2H9]|uniref:hypothetical protein n=1 Tax=Photobacterium sp. CCB-ST2H9 TaxID=2912855 RepID=UPI0020040065|nr:hypothetical protein [Photobacterium sp. CCB-ST2H9]UTM59248.1 hypothetical protein L4174_021330 [Photobacterium sp. CCB-ST2H9]
MDTKKLRIKYNNDWPKSFDFPVEETFLNRLRSKGLQQAFVSCDLGYSDNYQFQFYLGYLIDALDMLPKRPDLAFDHVWKALDSEFFLVQQEIGNQNCSRFDGFVDRILNDGKSSAVFLSYLPLIPYQTCEYAAKRVIEASNEADNHAKTLFSRAKSSLGASFVEKFVTKYPPGANGKPTPADQRKAGRLFRLIFSGNEVDLAGDKFLFSDEELSKFLIKVILANSRNERFHGGVFPPFRSSSAKLATYAHAYYLLHISYGLLLDVFLYRDHGVIQSNDVVSIMNNNLTIFSLLFGELS